MGNLFGTCIDMIIIFRFSCSVFMIAIDVCIFSKLSSLVAGYSVALLFAQVTMPAPSGVLCLYGFSFYMLLYNYLLKHLGMCGFCSLYIPDSIITYMSMLFLFTRFIILSSFSILLFAYGIPLIF